MLSSPLDISISSPSIDKIALLANLSLSLAFSSFFKSLRNFLDIIKSFAEFFNSEVFAIKNKKKKDKEREKEEDIKKKVNKKTRF